MAWTVYHQRSNGTKVIPFEHLGWRITRVTCEWKTSQDVPQRKHRSCLLMWKNNSDDKFLPESGIFFFKKSSSWSVWIAFFIVEIDSIPSKTFRAPKILKFNDCKLNFQKSLPKFFIILPEFLDYFVGFFRLWTLEVCCLGMRAIFSPNNYLVIYLQPRNPWSKPHKSRWDKVLYNKSLL